MQLSFENEIKNYLAELEENASRRRLFSLEKERSCTFNYKGKSYLNFSSNDYLNLSQNKRLIEASQKAAKHFGTSSSSSRLITGSYDYFKNLETKLCCFKKSEAALVFNSGYTANLGIIQALGHFKPVFLLDKLVHASFIDALRYSGQEFQRFRHNDMRHLEELVEKNKNRTIWILVDSLYSMDGDLAKLDDLLALKQSYKSVYLYIDEAHSTGVFGEKGSGLCENYPRNSFDMIMGTFSKALGSFGAYALCSQPIRELLINKSRSFIYTTALPASVIAANIAAIDVIESHPNWAGELQEKALQFRQAIQNLGFNSLNSESQIIPILCGSDEKALDLSLYLREKGIWATAIRNPTVPKGQSRIRLTLNRLHTAKDIKKLIEALKEFKEKE